MTQDEISVWEPVLKRHFLFQEMEREDLLEAALRMKPLSLPRGAILFQQGDPSDALYLVTSGELRILIQKGLSEKVIAYLGRGDLLGEMGLITGESRPVTARLETTSEFLVLQKKDFEDLCRQRPNFLLHVMRVLSRRLLAAAGAREELQVKGPQIIALVDALPAEQRPLFAVHLALSLVEQTRRRVLVVDLHPRAGEIARALGLTPVMTSESMLRQQDLRSRDIIRSIGVVHPSGLEILSIKPQVLGGKLFRAIFLLTNLLRENYDFVVVAMDPVLGEVERSILAEGDRWLVAGPSDRRSEVEEVAARLRSLPESREPDLVWLVSGAAPELSRPWERVPWPSELSQDFLRTGSPYEGLERFPATRRAVDRLARRLGRMKIGIAMGAGAALGYALIGVLKVLHREHIQVDMVAGTSMGSVIGGMYAAGMDPSEIEAVALKITKGWVYENMFWDLTIPRSGLLSGTMLLRFFRSLFGEREFKDLELPFASAATDIVSGEEVIIEEGKVAEAIRASCAIPVVYQPFHYMGRFLVDGGLVNPVPTRVLSRMGADLLFSVNLTLPVGGPSKPKADNSLLAGLPGPLLGPSAWEILHKTLDTMKFHVAQSRVEFAHVVIQPELHAFQWTEFHRAKEVIEVGEKAAEAALPKIKSFLPFFSNFCRMPIRNDGAGY